MNVLSTTNSTCSIANRRVYMEYSIYCFYIIHTPMNIHNIYIYINYIYGIIRHINGSGVGGHVY